MSKITYVDGDTKWVNDSGIDGSGKFYFNVTKHSLSGGNMCTVNLASVVRYMEHLDEEGKVQYFNQVMGVFSE